jgi:hypothetical protein
MGGHPHSSSSNVGRSQANQQVRDGDLYSAMGNISGGIMRFNISGYDQTPDVGPVGVQQKKDSHRVPRNNYGDQVAPDVKGNSSSPINSRKSAKA